MEIRCIHRHTIDEHPSCFLAGNVILPVEAEGIKVNKKGDIIVSPWWADPRYKIGFFDIETDGFKGNYNICLTWVIKEKDLYLNDGTVKPGKIYKGVIKKKDISSGNFDRDLVKEFVETLKQFKIIVGYYSKRFDMPFMRTRALYYGFNFPKFGEIYHFDLYYVVKRNFSLHRNTLEAITKLLGIDGKNHVEPEIWLRAKYGDKEALKYVLDHNVRDVIILEKLHEKIYQFSKFTKTSI